MKRTTISRIGMVILMTVCLGLAGTETSWAQQAAAPPRSEGSPWLTGAATVAGAVGSFFYIPFKVGVICPGSALVAVGNLAITGGNKVSAERVLRIGCTGTYVITPGMVRGREEFQGSGTP
jgi:hypothetical protein